MHWNISQHYAQCPQICLQAVHGIFMQFNENSKLSLTVTVTVSETLADNDKQ